MLTLLFAIVGVCLINCAYRVDRQIDDPSHFAVVSEIVTLFTGAGFFAACFAVNFAN